MKGSETGWIDTFTGHVRKPGQAHDVEQVAFEREVLNELVRLHAGVLLRMPWVQSLLAIGMGLLVYQHVPATWLAGWCLMTVSAECLRAYHARQVLKRPEQEDPVSAHWSFIGLAAIAGASVGLAALLFTPQLPLPDQSLLMIILFAMPAAGVSVAVSSRQILATYSLLILAPAAIRWALLYPAQTVTVAGLTVLYWAFILGVAGDGEQLLRRSVAIRRERDRMLQDLQQSHATVRAAVAESEQAAQTRARVLAAASHDLRQPLHALSVYSAVLVAKPAAETLPEIARNIDRLVANMGGLLHGLLDLSRFATDQYTLERQRISLDRLVQDVCSEYQSQARDKQLELKCELEHVRLYDDPVVIGRIVRNLLDNAIKYTDSGSVAVKTGMRDGKAELMIADTGKGIPESEQEKIFEEFYQLDNPGRDYSRGVGLGLAIVQRLCKLIDADMRLTSTSGAGTTFQLRFGCLAPEALPRPDLFDAAVKNLQAERIYLLDDEADILHAMTLLLRSWNLAVEAMQSAAQARQLFERKGKPDLLIVDLRLGDGVDGWTLAQSLRQSYGDFPVLVVTGETTLDALQPIHKAGCPLLQKPIDSNKLYAAIGSVMKLSA